MSDELLDCGVIIDRAHYHPYLNLDFWVKERAKYPAEDVERRTWFLHPLDFVHYSRLRAEGLHNVTHNGKQVPIDLVFWSTALATKPYLTRTGGAPYRPSHLSWPEFHGKPMTFIAQLCFRDSQDIAPNLPGDLLLIFADNLHELSDGGPTDDENPIYLEWVTIADIERTIAEEQCPASFSVPKFSGILHRYFDFEFQTFDYRQIRPSFETVQHWEELLNIRFTKLGGTYLEVQRGWDPREWIEEDAQLRRKWKLVATFHEICPLNLPACTFLDSPLAPHYEFRSAQQIASSIDFPGDPGHLVLFSGQKEATAYFIGG